MPRAIFDCDWSRRGTKTLLLGVKPHPGLGSGRYVEVITVKCPMIRTICHTRDLWKWACKQLRLLCPPDPCGLPVITLLCGWQNSREALKSTVLSKCSFIWNKGPVNTWKAGRSSIYHQPQQIWLSRHVESTDFNRSIAKCFKKLKSYVKYQKCTFSQNGPMGRALLYCVVAW